MLKTGFGFEAIPRDSVIEEIHTKHVKTKGLDPAVIKTIKSPEFSNTFIATKAFENRLTELFRICNTELLEIYINNIDKDLWISDSLVSKQLTATENQVEKAKIFQNFAKEKLTNVKNIEGTAKTLGDFYSKRLQEIQNELAKTLERIRDFGKDKKEEAEKKKQEYRKLLTKRLKYRMTAYGFKLKKTGWYNAAIPIHVVELDTFNLEIRVTNGQNLDRIHAYTVNPRIKTLYAFHSINSEKNLVSASYPYAQDNILISYINEQHAAIVIGYKNEESFLAIRRFKTQKRNDMTVTLKRVTKQQLVKELSFYDKGYQKKNSILNDLEYQKTFSEEQKRLAQQANEKHVIRHLMSKAYPCDKFICEHDALTEEFIN